MKKFLFGSMLLFFASTAWSDVATQMKCNFGSRDLSLNKAAKTITLNLLAGPDQVEVDLIQYRARLFCVGKPCFQATLEIIDQETSQQVHQATWKGLQKYKAVDNGEENHGFTGMNYIFQKNLSLVNPEDDLGVELQFWCSLL